MDLFPFLFPGKAQELASHQYASIINESLLEKNYELERKIDKLNAEKRAFEYFKRVLVEEHKGDHFLGEPSCFHKIEEQY